MTAPEVRSLVISYHRIRQSLHESTDEVSKDLFQAFLARAETLCYDVSDGSAPSRWARSTVGSVLAAGLGATVYMRGAKATVVLRIFGMTGTAALSNHAAWELIQPYVQEPVVCKSALEEIRHSSGLLLNQLPPAPSPAEVLVELTRAHSSEFALRMSRWLSLYFQREAPADSPYSAVYRNLMLDMAGRNEHRKMAHLIDHLPQTPLTVAEWDEMTQGRIPLARLESRAAISTTKKFLIDYWEHWQQAPLKSDAAVVYTP